MGLWVRDEELVEGGRNNWLFNVLHIHTYCTCTGIFGQIHLSICGILRVFATTHHTLPGRGLVYEGQL